MPETSRDGGLYVQYGCGFSTGEGWLNFDASPTLKITRMPVVGSVLGRLSGNQVTFPDEVMYGDIVAGLPVADGSVDGIYASHVLEHLSYEDFRQALSNTFRALRPGGIFRLIVPDLRSRAQAYLERGVDDPEAAHTFMLDTHLGSERRGRGLTDRVRAMIGNSRHLWMFDVASMTAELEKAGFTDIRTAKIGDSGDPMFDRVESEDRFVDGSFAEVAMQARKPRGA